MSKFSIVVLALALSACLARDGEDFAFDVADDLEVEFEGDKLVKWNERDLVAYVGRVFHLVVPRSGFEKDDSSLFEVKRHSGKGLPSWLLFDKKGGVFWGVPLAQDVGVLRLTIKDSKSSEEELAIKVVEPTEEPDAIEECQQNEDNTVLTLLLDKNIKAIKPKQRIIAINNIAKFFGLSYSAFTLKPQLEKDDITDSSVVLAGPGNLDARTSKVTSLLQVAVGCEGRLWLSTASMVHQLKQQARDGTVSEVLRLPLIGWRVKTETKPIVRTKRRVGGAAEDDFGSGDYNDEDEYYDDYEDYESEDLGDVEKMPPNSIDVGFLPTSKHSSKPTAGTPTTTGSMESTTHPHRHHHGELNPSVPVVHHQTTHKNLIVDEVAPVSLPPTLLEVPSTTKSLLLSGQSKATKPDEVLNYEDNYDYGQYDDDDDDLDESIESETIIPDMNRNAIKVDSITEEPIVKTTTSTELVTNTSPKPTSTSSTSSTTESVVIYSSSSTTSTESVTQTTPLQTTAIITETPVESIEDDRKDTTTEQLYAISREVTTKEQTTETIYNLTNVPAFVYTDSTTVTQQHYDISTTPSTATTNATPIYEVSTTPEELSTTEKEQLATQKSTTVKEVTEIEYHKNFNPFIENRLQPIVVVAGKIFRSVIPRNTFKDFEDEYDLTYQLLDSNNNTISNNSWLQFNAARRELYGLPLANDTSKYVFWVKAFDKDGGSEQEKLNIQVQQHKLELVVNHEFSLLIRIEKQQEFNHYVDWSLKVLRALGKIYNTNMTEITVRKINYTSEPIIFTWSNDSIPTNYCPRTEIVGLFQTLTANDRGDPSRELNVALSPELRVKKVIYRELGVCEQPLTPVTPPTNFSPLLRNPIDNITATVGQLLIYRVKEDTFYDPEDVDPRMLNVSLLTGDRQNIPGDNWLQFDNKNREFYGIPRKSGRSEYQLVCIDSGGKMVTDSLEVVVYPALKRAYNVEFSMNITDIPHEMFINSASLQRKFVEKLMVLFKEQTPAHFHFLPFKRSYDSTIVTWFNRSLSINRCPHEDIRRLESIVHNMNDRSISQKVHIAMEPEFKVSTIKVHLIGNCKPRVGQEQRPDISIPIEETSPQPNHNEYLTNYVLPALIVIIMLILAIIGALVLYRKKRIGKMNIEEDGRQSYGNKGIPVIFQEELEEKPEPGTKAPVILKDEKPPLAPPEYSKSGSVKLADDSEPYQPPPPFTRTQDNGRQGRPKPTPTYRKPPPYVPP